MGHILKNLGKIKIFGLIIITATLVILVGLLLLNILERKTEQKHAFVKLVQNTEEDTDPEKWKAN